jgi:hypothetical protein
VSASTTRAVPPSQLWWLAAGFGVWCSALVLLYAMHAIGCAFAWPADALRASLIVALLAHLVLIGWMWLRKPKAEPAFGEVSAFLHTVAVWTLIAAFVTTVFTLGPTFVIGVCR